MDSARRVHGAQAHLWHQLLLPSGHARSLRYRERVWLRWHVQRHAQQEADEAGRQELKNLVSFFSCYLDVPKMNCHPVHNGIQRRGYAGRVRKAYRAIIRQELARDASLYVGELSTPMRGRTGRMYSRKRLMAALWDIGYILEALVHRARAQDEAARSAHLTLMDNYCWRSSSSSTRRTYPAVIRRDSSGPGRRQQMYDYSLTNLQPPCCV